MKIGVLGAGSWGLSISHLLANNNAEVDVYVKEESDYETLLLNRELPDKLPGITLPESVGFSMELEKVVQGSSILVVAVPSVAVRSVCRLLNAQNIENGAIVLCLAKGIEFSTSMRMSQIMREELPSLDESQIAVLSGPSHAEEVARGISTSVVIASSSLQSAMKCQDVFMAPYFRVYASDDVAGVEIGGALKNIIAVGSGVLDGLGLGDNTRGALISRGLTEISRYAEFYGGKIRTVAGLAGLGDLVTTCISKHSRNRYVGEEIAKGKTLEEVLASMSMVAEGVETVKSVYHSAKKNDIEMPITDAIYQILYEGKSATEAVTELMVRDPKSELI